jgi:hypothetical protein
MDIFAIISLDYDKNIDIECGFRGSGDGADPGL